MACAANVNRFDLHRRVRRNQGTRIMTWFSEGRRTQHPPDPRSPLRLLYASAGRWCCEVARVRGVMGDSCPIKASGIGWITQRRNCTSRWSQADGLLTARVALRYASTFMTPKLSFTTPAANGRGGGWPADHPRLLAMPSCAADHSRSGYAIEAAFRERSTQRLLCTPSEGCQERGFPRRPPPPSRTARGSSP
jgi:hypothetical protein